MGTINQADRGHWQTIQQSGRTGLWWVSCHCPSGLEGIVSRLPVTATSSDCETRQDALDLARWHAGGEHGPAPEPAAALREPEQLNLFA